MRWVLQSDGPFRHWKSANSEIVSEIKYNREAHTFRIDSGDKRLFFLERTGFLHHTFLLRTEYSIVTGEIHFSKHGHNGVCFYDGRKFSFELNNDQLILLQKKKTEKLVVTLDDVSETDLFERCALIFGTVKMLSYRYKPGLKPVAA